MSRDLEFLGRLREQPIAPDLLTSAFSCNPEIDYFLTSVALDYHIKRITAVTCWLFDGDLAGYAATSMSSLMIESSPQRENLGLKGVSYKENGREYKRFPCLLIGMLGVCTRYQRRGLALEMLMITIGRARAISRDVGCRFVNVDSDRTAAAMGLYREAGFVEVERKEKEKADSDTVPMYFDLGEIA